MSRDHGGYQIKVEDGPWPAFPADLTSIAVALATQSEGSVLMFEKMFENRLVFTDKLVAMGANIILCDPHRAVISGATRLRGAKLVSPDIRAGMAMLIAALCAEGESEIGSIEQIDRGYERIDERLRALGAKIERREEAQRGPPSMAWLAIFLIAALAPACGRVEPSNWICEQSAPHCSDVARRRRVRLGDRVRPAPPRAAEERAEERHAVGRPWQLLAPTELDRLSCRSRRRRAAGARRRQPRQFGPRVPSTEVRTERCDAAGRHSAMRSLGVDSADDVGQQTAQPAAASPPSIVAEDRERGGHSRRWGAALTAARADTNRGTSGA